MPNRDVNIQQTACRQNPTLDFHRDPVDEIAAGASRVHGALLAARGLRILFRQVVPFPRQD